MLARHDWVTPTLGGNAWLEKPPLYYWQAMIAYRLFGVSDWAARLPSVFDASVLVFAVYWLLRKLRPGAELDAGVMLATSALLVGYARAASMDMPLAATFGIAMLAWFWWFESERLAYLATSYAFLGLAMLAKGPVAPFLAAVIIGVFALVRGRTDAMSKTIWVPGLLTFCFVALPWYVLVQLRNPQFFRVFILEHNLARFGTNMFHHPEPFWYYVPVSLLGWVPWTVFVVAALTWAFRQIRSRESDALNAFLAVWIAVMIVFFSISISKLPGYILPAIPPGIILLGNYLRERFTTKPNALLVALHGTVPAALLFSALLLARTLAEHRFVFDRAVVTPLILAIIAGALLSAFLFKAGLRSLRSATVIPAVLALAIAIRTGSPGLDKNLSARSVSEALAHVAPRNLPVAVVLVPRELEYGLEFYRNQKIPRYEWGQAPAGEHLVVAREGFQKSFSSNVPGRKVVYLGKFPEQKVEFFYVSE